MATKAKANRSRKRKSTRGRRRNTSTKSAAVRAASSTARKATPNPRRRRTHHKRRSTARRNPAPRRSTRALRNPAGSADILSLLLGGVGVALLENYIQPLNSQGGFAGVGIKGGAGWALLKFGHKLPKFVRGPAEAAGSVLLAVAAYQAGKLIFQQYIAPALGSWGQPQMGASQQGQGQLGYMPQGMGQLAYIPEADPFGVQ